MKKSILEQLAHTLGRRDETPNIALAERIADSQDTESVKTLVALFDSQPMAVKYDILKVLYETGERKPEMISAYTDMFAGLLTHKNNRVQWSAMTALSVIARSRPELLVPHLVHVVDAMDSGSVITRDHGIYILSALAARKKHHADCMELLLEQIEKSPVNQVPMYAEKTAEVISPTYIPRFKQILASRKDVLTIPTKQKRIEKLLRSLHG